jgi:hypothetical protein
LALLLFVLRRPRWSGKTAGHERKKHRHRWRDTPKSHSTQHEFIRSFGLNQGSLKGKRRKAVGEMKRRYLKDLQQLASWSDQDRRFYMEAELEAKLIREQAG